MTENTKIVIAIAALAAAAGIFFFTTRKDKPIVVDFCYKCTECGSVQNLSRNEVASKMAELRTVYPEITPMGLVVVCKDCGKQSCRYAVKCAQCKEVFVYNPRASHPEKCPKCGFEPVKNE